MLSAVCAQANLFHFHGNIKRAKLNTNMYTMILKNTIGVLFKNFMIKDNIL